MTFTLADVRTRDRIAPIPLVTITTLSGAVLRVSDRVVTVDGLTYDSGLLGHSSIDQAIDWDGRGALNADLTLTLRNDAVTLNEVAYSSLIAALDVHPIDRARVHVSYACTDDGQTTETETPFVGIAESPQDITTESLSLRCSSVHAYMVKKNPLEILGSESFSSTTVPNPGDIGLSLPVMFGAGCTASLIRSRWGGRDVLLNYLSAAGTTVDLSGDANDLADGIWEYRIEDEIITGTYSAGGDITSVTRGVNGTTAVEHAAGTAIYEAGPSFGIAANHAVDLIHYVQARVGDVWWNMAPTAMDESVTYEGKTRARVAIDTSLAAYLSVQPDAKYIAVLRGMVSDDAFFGTVGSLIERPDYVIKAWLVKILGYAQADIDATSFDAAGAFFATNSYVFRAEIQGVVDTRIIAQRMAFNCRSILQELAGVWYLAVIPDSAPASVKTVSQADLADEGAMFRFGSTDRDEVQDSINVQFNPAEAEGLSWRRSLTVSDVPAGETAQVGSVELHYASGTAMATAVGTVVLLQRKRILKTVRFDVWWDKTDLRPGDTITVEGAGFWEGVKFLITSCSLDGIARATFHAVEWWA